MSIAARLTAFTVICALATAEAAAKPSARCAPGAPTTWAQTPGPSDFSEYYPRRTELPSNGNVTLMCIVNNTGLLRQCRVTNETPPSAGFGAAALKLAKYFRVAQPGCPLPGHSVGVPIRFVLAPD